MTHYTRTGQKVRGDKSDGAMYLDLKVLIIDNNVFFKVLYIVYYCL